ncbi:MAG: hypothetical protein WCA44_18390, partial [Acidobacteriaceae bacterium]
EYEHHQLIAPVADALAQDAVPSLSYSQASRSMTLSAAWRSASRSSHCGLLDLSEVSVRKFHRKCKRSGT